MENVKALVLRAAGINCDKETAYALELAGADADMVHINKIIDNKSMLDDYQIAVFPGGFSFGDDVAAGKILANQVIHHLSEVFKKFVADGKLILGICNGFQVLVKSGLLPAIDENMDANGAQQQVTITYNDSGRFEDRWVHLMPVGNKCVFINPDEIIYLPVAHGEGKVLVKDDGVLEKLKSDGHVAFRYVDCEGNSGCFPVNPNGSTCDIAGLTDRTGRILGLMPHPERFVRHSQHPHWTRLGGEKRQDGVTIFKNAVNYVKENL